jgi:hypothetical protein
MKMTDNTETITTNAHKKIYRLGDLTVLQLMFILALAGIAATWAARHFFT